MSDDVWQVIAVIGLLFAAWTLLIAARGALQTQRVDLTLQARSMGIAYVTTILFILLLGLEVKPASTQFLPT